MCANSDMNIRFELIRIEEMHMKVNCSCEENLRRLVSPAIPYITYTIKSSAQQEKQQPLKMSGK